MYSDSLYHKCLRASALVVAFLLTMQSGIIVPETTLFTMQARMYMANVIGITASVVPNEINTLTGELTKRQKELDERERLIDARVRDSELQSFRFSDYILSIILLLLLILITTNYFLDYMRARKNERLDYAATS